MFIFIIKFFIILIPVLLLYGCSTPKSSGSNQEAQLSEAQKLLGEGKVAEGKLILQKLCDQNYGAGCSVLGGVHHQEHLNDYMSFYQKGCDLKDGFGCFGLAAIQYKRKENENFHKNINLSCAYGFQEACRIIQKIKTDALETKTKR